MLDTKSPSRAWIDLTDVFAPKKIIEKRRIEQKFDSISMAEGEDPVEYLSHIDQTVLKLAMLAGTSGNDDVSVHTVPKPVGVSSGGEKFLLSIPDLTRSKIEKIVRNAYMSHKQNFGKAKGQTKVMTHMLSTPAVLNRPVQGVTEWGGMQNGKYDIGDTDKQQKRKSQHQQQRQKRQHQSGGGGVVGSTCRLDL